MNEQVKVSDVLMCAFELVISRDGDIDTDDGSFATCGTDEIIRLDEAMAHFFDVGSDDLGLQYAGFILNKSKQLDQHIELIAEQAEQLKIMRDCIAEIRGGGLLLSEIESMCDKAIDSTKE